jgi:alkanesulfonate monooxygenase SsuD/methylene tetrahydromethanopterin reductase-like flavin-dependent oxidoreductase (luciferase family)
MQIGLCLPHFGRPLETDRLLQVAQRAATRGLDALWVTDHAMTYLRGRHAIHGTARQVVETLRGYAALGVSHAALDVSLTTYPAILETIDVLAHDVRPALAG